MPYSSREKRLAYLKEYRTKNREKNKAYGYERYHRLRRQVLEHYSGGDIKCACCGETEYFFMNIDHINNDGAEHRRSMNSKYIVEWLITHNYPDGFQILCANCNQAKRQGVCPHKLHS